MKNLLLLAVALITLSACSLPAVVWNKQGVTHEQFNQDSADCEIQAKQDNTGGVGPTTGSNIKSAYEQCMIIQGYIKQGESPSHHVKNAAPGVLSPVPVSQ